MFHLHQYITIYECIRYQDKHWALRWCWQTREFGVDEAHLWNNLWQLAHDQEKGCEIKLSRDPWKKPNVCRKIKIASNKLINKTNDYLILQSTGPSSAWGGCSSSTYGNKATTMALKCAENKLSLINIFRVASGKSIRHTSNKRLPTAGCFWTEFSLLTQEVNHFWKQE